MILLVILGPYAFRLELQNSKTKVYKRFRLNSDFAVF